MKKCNLTLPPNRNKFISFTILFFFLSLFIYFERESMCGEGTEREGDRESQADSMLPAQSPTQSSELTKP